MLTLPDLPFCIGAQPQPHNPPGIPDTYPFELVLDEAVGVLRQRAAPGLADLLRRAYALGTEIGTPSADSPGGLPYVDDFVAFIERHAPRPGRALEIGAGVGYLSSVLARRGWRVDSIEPGRGYATHWRRYGVDVINEFFPTPAAPGPYDLIVFYTVLEHIDDPQMFLRDVVTHLADGGIAVLAVPDCGDETAAGDPSMLLHEHFQYFTAAGLHRVLAAAGLYGVVTRSTYGRSVYAAVAAGAAASPMVDDDETRQLRDYARKVHALRDRLAERMAMALKAGSLGVFCPARALAVVDAGSPVRFFDDADALRGRYFPPFTAPVEGRGTLFADPPDALWIMSRTFGESLRAALAPHLGGRPVLTLEELAGA